MKYLIKHQGKEIPIEGHDDHISKWFALGTFYELGMLEFIQGLNLEGIFIDVGANVGNHSLFFYHFCNAQVVFAYEPIPENLELLEMNCNNTTIAIAPYGLSDEDGDSGYVTVKNNMGMCKLQGDGDIVIETLDNMEDDCSLLKIDAEGFEERIIMGGIKMIKRCHPHIFVEAQTEQERDKIDALLIPLGYERKERFNSTPTYHYD